MVSAEGLLAKPNRVERSLVVKVTCYGPRSSLSQVERKSWYLLGAGLDRVESIGECCFRVV
jgi:hypothetical protein